MPERPRLIDWSARVRALDRAAGIDRAGADFLTLRAAEGLAERLAQVRRSFTRAVLIGTGRGEVAARLGLGAALLRQLDPSPRRAALAAARHQGARTEVLPGETLPLAPGEADLALSVLQLHALDDPVGHLIQLRRALVPDGLMLATAFGGRTLAELRAALAEAEAELAGGLSPRVLPMADIRDLGHLLQRAGFALPVADAERVEVTYPDALALMRDLRAMGETNPLAGRRRRFTGRRVIERAAELYARHFARADGRVVASFELVTLTGWAPAPDQPRPLRPGSAAARLADALGTREESAGEPAPLPRPPGAG